MMHDRPASDRVSHRSAGAPPRRSRSAIRFAAIGAHFRRLLMTGDARAAEMTRTAFRLADAETLGFLRDAAETYRACGMSSSAQAVEALIPMFMNRRDRIVDQLGDLEYPSPSIDGLVRCAAEAAEELGA